MTFRREMEEMSRKTKRLEKENSTLSRKHDQTNRNILEMAEERTRDKDELDKLHKQELSMRGLIKAMQEQGRGVGGKKAATTNTGAAGSAGRGGGTGVLNDDDLDEDDDEEGTESEYDDEGEDLYEDEVEDGEAGEIVYGGSGPSKWETQTSVKTLNGAGGGGGAVAGKQAADASSSTAAVAKVPAAGSVVANGVR